MSEQSDFEKFLKSLGARKIEPARRHERWQVGQRVLPVPHNLSGSRAYRNYEQQALRMAREQGLAPQAVAPPPAGSERAAPPRRSVRPLAPRSQQRIQPGTRQDIELWNVLEAERYRQSLLRGAPMEGEVKRQRTIMRAEERLPMIVQYLREAGRPLSAMEIAEGLGWPRDSGGHAVLGIIRARSDIFRSTRGTRRKERFELVPKETTRQAETANVAPPARGQRPKFSQRFRRGKRRLPLER